MIDFFVLLLLFTAVTPVAGWWALLLIAAIWGWVRRWKRSPWVAALAAALAWGFWLALSGHPATMLQLVDRLQQILGVPGPVIFLLPPLYAALLAWSAARLAQGFRRAPS